MRIKSQREWEARKKEIDNTKYIHQKLEEKLGNNFILEL